MNDIVLDMELLSFLVEFGTVEFITTTKEPFKIGDMLYISESDRNCKIKTQITGLYFLKKRKSGLLCYHLTVNYII